MAFDIRRSKTKALPDGTQEIFQKIFGERHFSLKCFIRSAAFSLGAMAFLGIAGNNNNSRFALAPCPNHVTRKREGGRHDRRPYLPTTVRRFANMAAADR